MLGVWQTVLKMQSGDAMTKKQYKKISAQLDLITEYALEIHLESGQIMLNERIHVLLNDDAKKETIKRMLTTGDKMMLAVEDLRKELSKAVAP